MKALAFIDLLGFGNMVSSDSEKAKIVLNDFYDISYEHISKHDNIKGDLFSDSLLSFSSDPSLLVNVVSDIYRACLKQNNYYDFPLNKYFLLPRGGISFGHVDIQARNESPNLTKNFIISPALVHSAKMESKIKGSRLLIADTKDNDQQVFNWNNNIENILYENSTFTFWKTYKYYDSLWFLDLTKNFTQQQTEVIELIEISEKLVEANKQNKKVLEQHLQTLRIGLLSFTKFLTQFDNPLLKRILENYRDDSYWLIWITLIEIIMESRVSWALPMKQEVKDFYKEISLKPGWSNVIKEINKPNNNYLLKLFNNFISEMNI